MLIKVRELIQRLQGSSESPHLRACHVEYEMSLPEALRLAALGQHRVGLRQAILAYLKETRPHSSRDECVAILNGHVDRIRRAYNR